MAPVPTWMTQGGGATSGDRSSPTFADQGELEIGQQGDEGQIKAKVLSIRFEMR
jgi:hypothetical protein